MPLPPAYLGSELDGAVGAISDLLAKYHAELGGVLLAYARPRFATQRGASESVSGGGPYVHSHTGEALGRIFEELPVLHVRLSVDALVFKPCIGQILHGRVVSLSSGHLGLLVAGLFNATIHCDDMAEGYAFDEDSKAWIAGDEHASAVAAAAVAKDVAKYNEYASESGASSKAGKKRRRAEGDESATAAAPAYNRVLAANPGSISVGQHVAFRVTKLAHSQGILQLFGSFKDDGKAPMPPKPAPGADDWDSSLLHSFSAAASSGSGGIAHELLHASNSNSNSSSSTSSEFAALFNTAASSSSSGASGGGSSDVETPSPSKLSKHVDSEKEAKRKERSKERRAKRRESDAGAGAEAVDEPLANEEETPAPAPPAVGKNEEEVGAEKKPKKEKKEKKDKKAKRED